MVIDKIFPIKKVGGANVDKSNHIYDQIMSCEYLKDKGLTAIDDESLIDQNTLIVPIGGDGTVLHSSKIAIKHDVPILGINIGKVGFLADLVKYTLLAIVSEEEGGKDNFFVEERTLLALKDTNIMALNDISVCDQLSKNTIEYDLFLDKPNTSSTYWNAGRYTSNGVIISTPTGSTAYAMSVGGPVIEPTVDIFQISSIAPIFIGSRPIITRSDAKIKIDIRTHASRDLDIRADGQDIDATQFIINSTKNFKTYSIEVKKHDKKLKMLHLNNYNFFEAMKNKLGWRNI